MKTHSFQRCTYSANLTTSDKNAEASFLYRLHERGKADYPNTKAQASSRAMESKKTASISRQSAASPYEASGH